MKSITMTKFIKTLLTAIGILPLLANAADPIQHDAEHYILLEQYADKWASEDKAID